MSSNTRPCNHFHFKQFSLSDSQCGMKIGTDGVLLGSVAATYPPANVLDAGTGCGLIALMVAQKNQGPITALDIDPAAVRQASENVGNSPWSSRIKVLHTSLQEFSHTCSQRFGLIVCNPPFFHHSLKSACSRRNAARHSFTLPPGELIAGASALLSEEGKLLLIVPADQDRLFSELAMAHQLHVTGRMWIIPRAGKNPKRVILEMASQKKEVKENTLIIEENGRHQYSEEYKRLTGDYYLNF